MDCDRLEEECGMDASELKAYLQASLEHETEMLRTYTIASERIHGNEQLKERLRNFAEGNAKRSRQLMSELEQLS